MRGQSRRSIGCRNQRNVVDSTQVRLEIPHHEPATLIAGSRPDLCPVRQNVEGCVWWQFIRDEIEALDGFAASMLHTQ